jgi:hypothetical protein
MFAILGLAALSVQACSAPRPVEDERSGRNPFVGAWVITRAAVTDPAGTTVNEDPEPGLYIFTERHFSNMLIPGGDRAPFREESTGEERLAAYDNFIADAGTYEYTDTTLTVRNIIAKVPNVMPPYASGPVTYRWRLDGETLALTLRGAWAPVEGQITYTLSRRE